MGNHPSIWIRLFSWNGKVDRGFYAIAGLVLFIVKWNIDRLLGGHFFSVSWMPYQYLLPGIELPEAAHDQRDLFLVLAVTALPFIYVGVILTVKRLRSIGVPSFLAVLFFMPFINLLFFTVLSFLPAKGEERHTSEIPPPPFLTRFVPRTRTANFFFAIWAAVLPCLLLLLASVQVMSSYGWGVFVGIPFVLGMVSVLILCLYSRRTFLECMAVALSACALCGVCVFLFAIEGIICLVMAMFLAVPLAMLGGVVAYFIQSSYHASRVPPILLLAILPLIVAKATGSRASPRPA